MIRHINHKSFILIGGQDRSVLLNEVNGGEPAHFIKTYKLYFYRVGIFLKNISKKENHSAYVKFYAIILVNNF
jgi:hypothetical protein